MRQDYTTKPVLTLRRHEVGESIASASVWRRGAGMFSNIVNLMETLISWVVCRTLILLLRYSIVGTTITLWKCVGYHVREARDDHRVYSGVSRLSRVQFFAILLCKSAIRRLFFPSCSIAFSVLSAVCLFHVSWIGAFVLLLQFIFIRICCLGGDACLLSGNPKMRNPEPERNRKPESGIH